MLLLLLACDPDPVAPKSPVPTTGDGLFTYGCPVVGQARARVIQDITERPWGEEALAGPGDVLLMNEHAAFVIQGVGDPDTYYHYGGAPIDAVAVDGCEQAGPERFEELGFIVGQLNLTDFEASNLHQIRGETIEVVSDGQDGGPAIVEVSATDDRFWLVELTLVRATYEDGGRRDLGPLFGLDITLRYTLDPGASALQMEVLLDGEPVTDGFLVGALVFPSDELETYAFSSGSLSVGGFGLTLGVPWLAMGGDEGAQVVAMPGANMAYTEVSGVRALLDANQALVPLEVIGAVEPPSTSFLLGVGASDVGSASRSLEDYHVDPLGPGIEVGWADVDGVVVDPAGPVGGAVVELFAENSDGVWARLEQLRTDATGRFSGRTLAPGPWRAVARMDGRDTSAEVELAAGGQGWLEIGPPGALRMAVTDVWGEPVPGRVELEREDGEIEVFYPLPGEVMAVPPGTWDVWVSRGYAWRPLVTRVVVPEGGEAELHGVMSLALETPGWASIDTHVHAEASADSDTLATQRLRTAVASGLDVMVSTDHEAILDLSPVLDGMGLSDTLAYGLGSEVTATVPEHINAWPFPVQDDPRGNAVVWYEQGFPGIYAAIRARGARVIQLNHSRVNGSCGILCVLDWDRLSESPSMDDPEALGLPAGTEIWSWDFDSFEVMNDSRSPLLDPDDPRHTGAMVDWLAFHNLGHRVTGTAVTDVHGEEIPGQPLTWVRVLDDTAGVVTADDVADGELAGQAVISSGAFIEVDVLGAGPGDTALAAPGEVPLGLRVSAIPEIDVTDVFVLVDCDLAAQLGTSDPYGTIKLDTTVPLTLSQDAYVVVLVFGRDPMPRGLQDYDPTDVPRAISNPVFIDVDGDGAWSAPGPKQCATGIEVGTRG